MRGFVCAAIVTCGLLAATCGPSFGQSSTSPDPSATSSSAQTQESATGPSTSSAQAQEPATPPASALTSPPPTPAPVQPAPQVMNTDSGRVGIGVKFSLLGIGGEGAVRLNHYLNARAGFNGFTYSRGFNKDGVAYSGQIDFKTFEAHLDYFPWAGTFHISPGVLVYAADPITATANVPAGQTFTLGGVTYTSDPSGANPLTGTGKIKFNTAAPMITFGTGNLVSRKEGKHFTVPFEIGVAFQGSPKATLALNGTVCDTTGICHNAATDQTVQANVISEQNKVNNSMSFFKAYPIISVGFGYKF